MFPCLCGAVYGLITTDLPFDGAEAKGDRLAGSLRHTAARLDFRQFLALHARAADNCMWSGGPLPYPGAWRLVFTPYIDSCRMPACTSIMRECRSTALASSRARITGLPVPQGAVAPWSRAENGDTASLETYNS